MIMEDPEYDKTIHIEKSPHIMGMERSVRVKSNGRHEVLVCYGATQVYVHVIVPNSMHWVLLPFIDLPYKGIGDGLTQRNMNFKIYDIFTIRVCYKMLFKGMTHMS